LYITLAAYKTALRNRAKDLKAKRRADVELALITQEDLPSRDNDVEREIKLISQILKMLKVII